MAGISPISKLEWDEDLYYARSFRLGMIAALAFVLAVFIISPKEFEVTPYTLRKEITTIMEELPPELEKLAEPPPVARPQLPVAATVPEEAEATTIAPTEFTEIIKKPELTEVPVVPFWKVEVKPKPEYIPQPTYPEAARLAGIEGTVVVEALVDVDGKIIDARILKSANPALDEAALRAASQARFTPAKQRDMFVRVWVSIPFRFTLTGR
ncbi:MAG: TonB family protein [candidate division WOR-3 bacterium]